MFARVQKTGSTPNSATQNLTNTLEYLKDLKTLWKPYLLLMKLLGLLNFCESNYRTLGFYIWNLYSILLLILTWTNVAYHILRCFSAQLGVNMNFIYETSVVCWNLSMAVARTNLFVVSHRALCLPKFFQHWRELKFDLKYTDVLQKHISRYSWKVLGFSLCLGLFKIIVLLFGAFTQVNFFLTNWFSCIERTVTIYNSIVDVVAMGYFILNCITVGKVFDILNKQLKEQASRDAIDIEQFHYNYSCATELMQVADNCLTFYSGFIIVNNLVSTASLTYLEIHHTHETWNEFTYTVYWMLDGLTWMVLTCYLASTVNTKAHMAHHTLCKIPVLHMPLREQAQVISLQMRLCNSTSGFTLFGIQVVTKGLLPTIISGYASYIFLLVQFQQPKDCLKMCSTIKVSGDIDI